MKRLLTSALLLSLLLFSLQFTASAQWTQTFGPFGWDTHHIAYGNGFVFASGNRISRSSDYGMTWQEKSFGIWQWDANDIFVSGNRVFAAFYESDIGYLYVSDDNGELWSQINNLGTTSPVMGITKAGTNLFVATYRKGVFKSTDNGDSWSQTTGLGNLPPTCTSIHGVGSALYLGTDGSGVLKSTDDGTSWFNCGPLDVYNAAISLSSRNGVVFAVSFSWAGYGNAVFRSVNGGVTWDQISFQNMPYARSVSTDANFVYVSTDAGIFRSNNDGATWTQIGFTETGAQTVINANGNLVAGFLGIHTSTDQGQTWINTGWYDNVMVHTVHAQNSAVFAACDGQTGLRISRDNGNTFTQYTNMNQTYPRCLEQRGTDLFAGGEPYITNKGGIYKSGDLGHTWSFIGLPNKSIFCIAFKDSYLFAGSLSDGIFRTSNDGNTWVQINQGMPLYWVKSLAVYGNTVYAGTQSGLYKSDNDGINWSPAGFNNVAVNALTINNGKLFAGTGTGVYLFEASGNWSQVGQITQDILMLNSFHSTLIAGGTNFLSKSTDNGTTWISILDNLPNTNFVDFTVNNDFAYVATATEGLQRRPISQVITDIGDDVSTTPSVFDLKQNYPNPFNPSTMISYTVQKAGKITLKVYDLLGNEVATLLNEYKSPGNYELRFYAGNLPSGTYFYRISGPEGSKTMKLQLVK